MHNNVLRQWSVRQVYGMTLCGQTKTRKCLHKNNSIDMCLKENTSLCNFMNGKPMKKFVVYFVWIFQIENYR